MTKQETKKDETVKELPEEDEIIKEQPISMTVAIKKSVTWITFTLLFGLLPFWSWMVMEILLVGGFLFKNLIMDGVLLLFSTAIVSSLVADYLIFQKAPFSNLWDTFVFGLFPAYIIVNCTVIYIFIHGRIINENFKIIYSIEMSIFILSLFYVALTKFWILSKRD